MAETTDELLARMANKYGLANPAPSAGTPPPQPPKPEPQPQRRSLIDMVHDRKSAIDKATGYACGGKIKHMAQGGKIQGPGTPTSDSIPAEVQDTGEPIKVSTGERILSASQDAVMEEIARKLGFESLDALLEAETGKPVGPTVKGGMRAAALGAAPDDLMTYLNRGDPLKDAYKAVTRNQLQPSPGPQWNDDGTGLVFDAPKAAATNPLASAPSPAPSIATPPAASPSKPAPIATAAPLISLASVPQPAQERSVMDIYKNASDINAQTIASQGGPKVAGIRDPGPAESRSFDNFLARSSIQSAMESAAKSGNPKLLATVPGLAAQLGALSGQIPSQDLARDQLNQQGELKRQELSQDARFKGAQVGVQQDEAKARGLQASAALGEQADKAATNSLTRDIGRLELGQRQQRDGLLQKALAGDAKALEQLSAINRAEKGGQGKWQVARTGTTDPSGAQTTGYDIVNDATGEVRRGGGGTQQQSITRADVDSAIKRGADPKSVAERIRSMGQDPKNYGL